VVVKLTRTDLETKEELLDEIETVDVLDPGGDLEDVVEAVFVFDNIELGVIVRDTIPEKLI
jgi:hypothetical protein